MRLSKLPIRTPTHPEFTPTEVARQGAAEAASAPSNVAAGVCACAPTDRIANSANAKRDSFGVVISALRRLGRTHGPRSTLAIARLAGDGPGGRLHFLASGRVIVRRGRGGVLELLQAGYQLMWRRIKRRTMSMPAQRESRTLRACRCHEPNSIQGDGRGVRCMARWPQARPRRWPARRNPKPCWRSRWSSPRRATRCR